MKLWMYQEWLADIEEEHQFAKTYTVLGGAFHNPEAAKKMMTDDSPDKISVSDDDLEEASQRVLDEIKAEALLKQQPKSKHRRFRVIKDE